MLTKGRAVGFLGVVMLVVLFSSLAMAANFITVTQSENGKIAPVGPKVSDTVSHAPVAPDGSRTFTITPKGHYHVDEIFIDQGSGEESISLTPLPGTLWTNAKGNVYFYKFTGVADNTHAIRATFAIDTATLTVDRTTLSLGEGSGSASGTIPVTGTVISCTSDPGDEEDCGQTVDYGTTVTLTASADVGSIFEGWSGACKGKNAACTVKVTKAATAYAKFTRVYTLNINPEGGSGTGKVTGKGINCGSDCNEAFKAGTVVTLVATPNSPYGFGGWSEGTTGSAKSIKVTMNSDKNITATFGPTGAGIKIAEKVSVVDTKSGVGINQVKPLTIGRFGLADFPDNSDFYKDRTQIMVNERSANAFKKVNEILCMIGQTKYDEMLNQGNYKAQVDKNLCSSSQDDPSSVAEESQNQSSGSTMPKYEMWIVNSTRADDNSDHIVKVWIHESPPESPPGGGGQGGPKGGRAIFAKAVITEGITQDNPYGIFKMTVAVYPEIDGEIRPVVLGKSVLKAERDPQTNRVLLKFARNDNVDIPGDQNPSGHPYYIQRATLDRTANGSTGGGSVYDESYEPMPVPTHKEETFDFAFNSANFLRVDGEGTPTCVDRTQFDETAWRYGLYDSDGARVNRNSGFPIKRTQVEQGKTRDYYGWIGYYGTWFPAEVSLASGDQVYKMEFGPGGGSGEPYDVLISGGKLKKHVRKEMTLGAIKNVPIDYSEFDPQHPEILPVNYRVKWDGTNFMKVEWLDQSGSNFLWKKLPSPEVYDISTLNHDMLNFWSQSLGGNVQIKLNCTVESMPPCGQPPCSPPTFTCSASDDLPVAFYAESVVFPGDPIPTNFMCFTNCPDLSKIQSGDSWPYNDYGPPQSAPPAQYDSYDFDDAQMVLKSGTTPLTATNSTYQFGVMSGPLFEPTTDNLNLLACDWDETMICGWQAWNKLPVFYTWETGPNQWNHFTALVKGDTVLKFDPPLQVSYVQTWEDDTTSTFNLEYSGFGNLQGIPGHCIAWDTGEEVDCGQETRWIPQFSIHEGDEVTDVSNGTPYYVKPLEKEQRMRKVDDSVCSNANLSTAPYPLPNINEWQDPGIGPEPTVSGPPAVIGGVLQ